jgi:hypothetical protein
LCSASEPLWRTRRRWRSPRRTRTTPVLLVRRLTRRRRRLIRHPNPRQIRHQRIGLRQQFRRPQRLAPRRVRRLKRCRVPLSPKPVQPPNRVTLRRQTQTLGWCRVPEACTAALPSRAATPPDQLRRRPPKPRYPLPSPRLRLSRSRTSTSWTPRRRLRSRPWRRLSRSRTQRRPPQSRCNRWLHEKLRHRMRRRVIRKRQRILRSTP